MEQDWQSHLPSNLDRLKHLLESRKFSDCQFQVDTGDQQRNYYVHKLLLAMASPVFEKMFYGSSATSGCLIVVEDIEPDTFLTMLEYIYSDDININSIEKAFKLYYAAKKYMLPHVLNTCIKYIFDNLSSQTACRAYEFAKFYDEKGILKKSKKILTQLTNDVIEHPSFLDIEVSTLLVILDMERPYALSEVDMFNALERYAEKRLAKVDTELSSLSQQEIPTKDEANEKEASSNNSIVNADDLHEALKKIRFLDMTPTGFANGPAHSKLLQDKETLSIFKKLCSTNDKCQLPEGFTSKKKRSVKSLNVSLNYTYYSSSEEENLS